MDTETFTAYIYQIYDHLDGLRYIGSTTKDVKHRLKKHESNYRAYKCDTYPFVTSFHVLCNGDYDISIVETVEVSSIKELRQIEGRHIKAFNCVNKMVAGRTNKEYHQQNKESIHVKQKQYREFHKDVIQTRGKYYYELNKKLIREKQNNYRLENKDKIQAHKSKVVVCECGMSSTTSHIQRHRRTKKHIQYMKSLN